MKPSDGNDQTPAKCLSDQALLEEIGRGLREAYDGMLVQALPERLTGLIERIESASTSKPPPNELRAYVTGRGFTGLTGG